MPLAAPAPIQEVAVLADVVVSVRPLDERERLDLDRLVRSHTTVGLGVVALLAAGIVAAVGGQIMAPRELWLLSLLGLIFPFADRSSRWLVRFRRARALRRDRVLGKVLILESALGRSERLAVSGVAWRTNEDPAPWRNES